MKQTLSQAVMAELKRREATKSLVSGIAKHFVQPKTKPVDSVFEKCYDNSHWSLDD